LGGQRGREDKQKAFGELKICCLKLKIKEIKLNLRLKRSVQSLCNFNLADTPRKKMLMLQLFHSLFLETTRERKLSIIQLSSAVPPMVWIQNQLVGSAIGQRIVLECQSEAYPKSINYWMKNETIITLGNFGYVKTDVIVCLRGEDCVVN
jgi:hypothetical protein